MLNEYEATLCTKSGDIIETSNHYAICPRDVAYSVFRQRPYRALTTSDTFNNLRGKPSVTYILCVKRVKAQRASSVRCYGLF